MLVNQYSYWSNWNTAYFVQNSVMSIGFTIPVRDYKGTPTWYFRFLWNDDGRTTRETRQWNKLCCEYC